MNIREGKMINITRIFSAIALSILFLSTSSVNAGNDFIVVDLRTDLPDVLDSLDYQIYIASDGGPNDNFPTFTSAWLSIDLDDEPGDYGAKFTQVGLMADSNGLYWFVYSESGVECLRGEITYWNIDLNKFLGCKGEIGDLVEFGPLHKVELVTYGNGFWIARVADSQGLSHDVAKILSESLDIFDAQAVMEEGWSQIQDPFEFGSFFFWHPQYNNWSTGFTEWPQSFGGINNLYASPINICPAQYGAFTFWDADPRYWFAGSGGNICDAIMFPYTRHHLPLLIRE